jgi:type I restriction enzyme S subunit
MRMPSYREVVLGDAVEFLDHLRRPVTEADRVAGPYPYYGANGQQDSVDGWLFDEPLVLLAEDGGHFDDPRRGIAYPVTGKCWVNNHAHVLRPKAGTDFRFLAWQLSRYPIGRFVTGSTRGKLNKSAAMTIPIVLPTLVEQRRIAAILDEADAVRRKRREALGLLDDLLRSTFLQMFGDPVTNPKGWAKRPIESIVLDGFRNGLSPSKTGEVAGRVLTLGAVTGARFNPNLAKDALFDTAPDSSQIVSSGMFLICRGNGNADMVGSGKFCKETPERVILPDTVIACRPDPELVHPLYLESVWASDLVRRQIDAGARTTNGTFKINQQVLGAVEVTLPAMERQDAFASVASRIGDIADDMRSNLAESETLFSSLLHRAFTGAL